MRLKECFWRQRTRRLHALPGDDRSPALDRFAKHAAEISTHPDPLMTLWNSSLIGTISAGAVRDLRVPMMGHGDKVLLITTGKRLPSLRGHQHS